MGARNPIRIGAVFNRLTVISEAPFSLNAQGEKIYRVLAKCLCGNEKSIAEYDLRRGHVQSCGCWNIDSHVTHKMTRSTVYRCWSAMLNRCTNPNNKNFNGYGGRGIEVCKRWHKFENFLADMGNPPPGTSLDRMNNNKGYSQKNCRWATAIEQSNNRRSSIFVTLNGETISAAEAARTLAINRGNFGKIAQREGSYQAAVDYLLISKRRGPYKKRN